MDQGLTTRGRARHRGRWTTCRFRETAHQMVYEVRRGPSRNACRGEADLATPMTHHEHVRLFVPRHAHEGVVAANVLDHHSTPDGPVPLAHASSGSRWPLVVQRCPRSAPSRCRDWLLYRKSHSRRRTRCSHGARSHHTRSDSTERRVTPGHPSHTHGSKRRLDTRWVTSHRKRNRSIDAASCSVMQSGVGSSGALRHFKLRSRSASVGTKCTTRP